MNHLGMHIQSADLHIIYAEYSYKGTTSFVAKCMLCSMITTYLEKLQNYYRRKLIFIDSVSYAP